MKKITLLVLFIGFSSTILNAENNSSKNETNSTKIENNKNKQEDLTKKQIQEQMEREKKYAKEQKFYQGDEYNLSSAEINKKSLLSIPTIEPDYDFDMDDAYSDEQ